MLGLLKHITINSTRNVTQALPSMRNTHNWTALTPNFYLEEFLQDGLNSIDINDDIKQNLRYLANRLQVIRDMLGGKAITITSGYRSPKQNQQAGGVPNSQHLTGLAADFTVAGMPPHRVQQALSHWAGGLGCYHTFTHVDLGSKRRWGPNA